jgi:hypothetical protein
MRGITLRRRARGMSCGAAIRSIARALEGRVAFNELDALVDHLERCAACHAEAETQMVVKRTLASRPHEPLPGGFARRLAARLDAECALLVRRPTDWRRWTIRVLPAAAGVVLVAATIQRFNRHTSPSIDLPSALASWAQNEMCLLRPSLSGDLNDQKLLGALLMNTPQTMSPSTSSRTVSGEKDVGR